MEKLRKDKKIIGQKFVDAETAAQYDTQPPAAYEFTDDAASAAE